MKKHKYIKEHLSSLSPGEIKPILEENPKMIRYIDQSKFKYFLLGFLTENKPIISYLDSIHRDLFKLLVAEDAENFSYMKGLTEKDIEEAVLINEYTMVYISDPPEKLQILAVNNNPECVFMIKNPTFVVKLIACSKIPEMVLNMKEEIEELQIVSSFSFDNSYMYIYSPLEYDKPNGLIDQIDEEEKINHFTYRAKKLSVKKNPFTIILIDDPDEELQLIAVRKNPEALLNIRNPSKKAIKEAIKRDIKILSYLNNIDKEIQQFAIRHNKQAIKYIKDLDESIAIKELFKE